MIFKKSMFLVETITGTGVVGAGTYYGVTHYYKKPKQTVEELRKLVEEKLKEPVPGIGSLEEDKNANKENETDIPILNVQADPIKQEQISNTQPSSLKSN